MIKLIVAYDPNRLIGIGDELAWNIKEDLEHFKKETLNKTILFGEVTFNGIGRPLPNRKTVILTLDKNFKYDHENVEVVNDMQLIIDKYQGNKDDDIIIAGGATIYKLFLPYVDEMIVSHIKHIYEGDKYFPEWNIKDYIVVEKINYQDFIFKRYLKK